MTNKTSVNAFPPLAIFAVAKTCWDGVMTVEKSSLSNLNPVVGHMVFQILAFIWSGVFSVMLGSYLVFGISATLHVVFIAGVFITAFTLNQAKNNPQVINSYGYNGRAPNGEHE